MFNLQIINLPGGATGEVVVGFGCILVGNRPCFSKYL